MSMDINEAVENWERGNRSTVRRACMENENLYHALKTYLSLEDYAVLTERIELRNQA